MGQKEKRGRLKRTLYCSSGIHLYVLRVSICFCSISSIQKRTKICNVVPEAHDESY